MAELKRTLGLAECIFFGAGSILGAGIYTIIGKVAGAAGDLVWLAFLIASVTALATAFSYAELSAMYPKAGGEYTYTEQAFGQKIALIVGFLISLNGVVSGATVALAFSGYFSNFLDLPLLIPAFSIIGLILLVNIIGIKNSSKVNIVFTVIEFIGLLLVIYTGLTQNDLKVPTAMPEGGINSLLMAASLSFFAFIGFEEIVKLSQETRNPEKNIPRALFGACAIVIVVYFLVAVACINVIPAQQLATSEGPLADVVSTKMGQTGLLVISLIALFSTSNTILSNMIGSSRLVMAMTEKMPNLKMLSKVSEKTQTPIFSLILVAAVMFLFALIGNLKTIALIANFFILTTFLVINITVIYLRKKEPETKRPYRIPFSIGAIPIISVAAILMVLVLISYTVYALAIGAL